MLQEILGVLNSWTREGKRFALATVVQTSGSSPRPIGSMMAVCEDGRMAGSVSGGCVESAVIEQANRTIQHGVSKVLSFSAVEAGDVWNVGLSCGGSIQVLVEPGWGRGETDEGTKGRRDEGTKDHRDKGTKGHAWGEAVRKTREGESFVWVTRAVGERVEHALIDPKGSVVGEADDEVRQEALSAFASRSSGEICVNEQKYFVIVNRGPETLIVVGGVHIAVPLLKFAKDLGFRTVLIEPRAQFSGTDRFEAAPDEVHVAWPKVVLPNMILNEDIYAVTLTHDPKIDDDALRILLKSDAAYIGSLGGRKTQEQRREKLKSEGFSDQELARIHGPVGLDIAAQTPSEIALSIMAEIVKVRRGRK